MASRKAALHKARSSASAGCSGPAAARRVAPPSRSRCRSPACSRPEWRRNIPDSACFSGWASRSSWPPLGFAPRAGRHEVPPLIACAIRCIRNYRFCNHQDRVAARVPIAMIGAAGRTASGIEADVMSDILALETFLPYRLNRLAEAVSREFYAVYRKKYGLTRPEWRLLATLGQFGTMTATAVARHSAMHKTKVSRAVTALEKRRWLAREADDR